MPTNTTARSRSPCREPVLIARPPCPEAYAAHRTPSIRSMNQVPALQKAGIIYDVSDPQPSPSRRTVNDGSAKVHWWSRPSPWLYGLVVLLAIVALFAVQTPRASTAASTRGRAPSSAPTAALPALSGRAYTQAMVAGRNFVGADLRGARLIHLDLRGDNFQGVDAAGAVFAGSFLNGASFSHANLRGADLRDTCLRGAELTEAQLAGADFTGADVAGVTIVPVARSEIIGWTSNPTSMVCPGGLAIALSADV